MMFAMECAGLWPHWLYHLQKLVYIFLPEVEPAVEMQGIEWIQGIQVNMLYHRIAFVGLLSQEDGFPEGDHDRDMLFPGKMNHAGEKWPIRRSGTTFL